ncbi:MAG: hypothetical protein KDC13_05710 [Bacteroidetes bacterium]|nr:hypothetical protein [Bacteroidota bacterium]
MKKQVFYTIAAGFMVLASCGQQVNKDSISTQDLLQTTDKVVKSGKASTAIEYNDAIVGLQARIIEEMLVVLNLEGKDPVADLKHLTSTVKTCREELKALQVFEGGEDLKQAADELFSFYQRACEKPWLKAFEIYVSANREMDETQSKEFLALLEEGSSGEEKYDNAFAAAQEGFARRYGFAIIDNELQGKIDDAGK